jgi:hypothetical protein
MGGRIVAITFLTPARCPTKSSDLSARAPLNGREIGFTDAKVIDLLGISREKVRCVLRSDRPTLPRLISLPLLLSDKRGLPKDFKRMHAC